MASDMSAIVRRVYIRGDYSYPTGFSLSWKRSWIRVLSNLMGEARQDGRLQLAKQLDERLKKYRTRLDQEIKAAKNRPAPSALFTTGDLARTALKEPSQD